MEKRWDISQVPNIHLNILERKKEIRNLIARANFEKAFKRLIDFADDFADNSHQSQVIIKSAEFNALIDDKMTGFLPYGEYKKYRNEIISNVLLLMDAIADSYSDY